MADKDRLSTAIELAYDLSLATLLVFTPLAFGSVHIWAYSISEILVFALSTLWCIKIIITPGYALDKRLLPLAIASAVFLLLGFLSMIPLPREVIKILSPSAHDLYSHVINNYTDINTSVHIVQPLSIVSHLTLKSLLKTSSYMLLFFSAAHELRNTKRVNRIFILIIALGLFESYYGLSLFVQQKLKIFSFKRGPALGAWGTYVNKNHFAGYLGMTALLGTGYLFASIPSTKNMGTIKNYISNLFKSSASVKHILIIISIVLMALAVAFSNSRMGILALLLSFALLISVLARRQRKAKSIILSGFILTLSASIIYMSSDVLKYRLLNIVSDMKSSRLMIWDKTIDLIRDYPITGSGLGTYKEIFQHYTPYGFNSVTRHAHNDYLELAAETGTIGILIAIFALGYFTILYTRLWRENGDKRKSIASIGAFASFFFILVFSLSDFNLQIPANAYLFTLSIALSYAVLVTSDKPVLGNKPSGAGRYSIAVILITLMLPLIFLSTQQLRAEKLLSTESTFIKASDSSTAISDTMADNAANALTLFPGNWKYDQIMGKYNIQRSRDERLPEDIRITHIKNARDHYIKSLKMNPASLDSLSLLAWAEFSMGDYLSATRHLNTTLTIAPTNYSGHLFYAIAVTAFLDSLPETLKRAYLFKASAEFQKGIKMNPQFARSSIVLARMGNAFLRSGDIKNAQIYFEKITSFTPEVLVYTLINAGIYIKNTDYKKAADQYRRMFKLTNKDNAMRRQVVDSLASELEQYPDALELRELLMRFQRNLNDWNGLINTLKGKLGMDARKDSRTYIEIGTSYERLGKRELAKSAYINSLKAHKNNRKASKKLLGLLQENQ
jgi:O-antigen ligase/Tfp pilus assembly protein PilF